MKGLRVEVLSGVFTNQVWFPQLTLVGDGVPEISEADDDAPAVEIVPGNLSGTLKAVLVDGADSPAAFIAPGKAGRNWSMASGAFIHTSDSRFREFSGGHPVALHNRYEVSA